MTRINREMVQIFFFLDPSDSDLCPLHCSCLPLF
ncbi:unnamed protein product [Linum tenue]|uniref:Uncharacterized protein n=1 Tax=Linum tenue TaxID=586396 RepID=A0AAV0Q996_9ROSI|nr:unnamed protein product [Linum tenue]